LNDVIKVISNRLANNRLALTQVLFHSTWDWIKLQAPNTRNITMIAFKVNSEPASFDGDPDTPLLWVLRDQLHKTGTKFGCGIGLCGACTVHLDGRAQRSCVIPASSIQGKDITTIEGLSGQAGLKLHPVQQAWVELDVPQCGYCQSGQIMATVDLLSRIPDPTDEDIDRELTNICRCGTYVRIRKAIHRAAELSAQES
jgi:isoquinoline 1-oxidoreductase alpha subunit